MLTEPGTETLRPPDQVRMRLTWTATVRYALAGLLFAESRTPMVFLNYAYSISPAPSVILSANRQFAFPYKSIPTSDPRPSTPPAGNGVPSGRGPFGANALFRCGRRHTDGPKYTRSAAHCPLPAVIFASRQSRRSEAQAESGLAPTDTRPSPASSKCNGVLCGFRAVMDSVSWHSPHRRISCG